MERKHIHTILFGVLSFLVMFLVEIPFFGFPWLKYDPSEAVNMIIAFKFGTLDGILCALIRNFLFYLAKGDGYGIAGLIPTTIYSVVFILAAAIPYRIRRTRKTAVLSLAAATVLSGLAMLPVNYVLVKYVLGFELDFSRYAAAGLVPFNLLKGAANSVILIIFYKRLSKITGY